MGRLLRRLCFLSLVLVLGEWHAESGVRATPKTGRSVVRAQSGPFEWHCFGPIDPGPLDGHPELSPLAIDRQLLPFDDRPLTLEEAIGTAIQHSDVVRVLDGGAVQVSGATSYDPAILEAEREAEFAIFDPKLTLGYVGSQINEPPSSFFGPGIPQQTRRDEGDFAASLGRLWQTGATTSVSYAPSLGYLFFPDGSSGQFNPIYSSAYVFEAKQPLLKGAGLEVNRAPLRIAQLRREQSAWEFKQSLLAQVRSVEEAYWELQAAYIAQRAIDEIVPLAAEAVRIEEARLTTEMAIYADVARARTQLSQFRQQQLRADANSREKEFRLRNLIGLPPVDEARLVPQDMPLNQPPELNADAVAVAIEHRPDIVQRRLALRIRELEWTVAENGVLPQVDLRALYRANGVGQELDNALNQASAFGFTDWTVGLTFSMPIGNRATRANLRAAEWQLTRERALLRESVRNVAYRLADVVRDVNLAWNEYDQAMQRAENCQVWLETARIRFTTPPPSSQSPDGLLLLLYDYQAAMRARIDAVVEASMLLAKYNGLLARFEEAQGTLLMTRGVELADDAVTVARRHGVPLYLDLFAWRKRPDAYGGPVIPLTTSPETISTPTNGFLAGYRGGWTSPPGSPDTALNPAGDYRAPASLHRSPLQAGWSPPPNTGQPQVPMSP